MKKSQITSGSLQALLENSLFEFHTHAGPHPKEKCWFITKTNVGKINPVYPLCYFHAGMHQLNYWSFTRCWAAQGVLSLGCRYFIDTSDVFLIYNHTAITHQLCNHYDGFAECAFWFELIERPNIFFFNVIEVKTAQGLQKHSLLADILGTPARVSNLI